MSDKPKRWSTPCSRRSLLLDAAVAVTAVTATAAALAASASNILLKISQSAVGYQDHPNGEKRCSECVHFLPPSSCNRVDGMISPQGYCRIFASRQSASARWGQSAVAG